jgi:L-asparagine oxygenase
MTNGSTEAQDPGSSEQIVEHHISAQSMASISLAAIKTAHRLQGNIETDAPEFARAGARILSEYLPTSEATALRDFGRRQDQCVLLLRNALSVATPDTPVNGFAENGLLKPYDLVLAGAMQLAGIRPTAFSFENSGKIARNVVSNPAQRGKASSHGFDVDLYWHQDNCGQPFDREQIPGCDLPPMPEYLAFVGIRNDERVPTRILRVDQVLRSLHASTKALLSKPLYSIGAPDSVAADGFESTHIEHAPILRLEHGEFQMRYDPLLVSTKDPAALLAHARLALELEAKTHMANDIIVGAGDVMILRNYRVLHMRVAFQPLEASRSRWLRRFYGRRS